MPYYAAQKISVVRQKKKKNKQAKRLTNAPLGYQFDLFLCI